MKTSLARALALLLIMICVSSPVWATCGGGGGGGGGGMASSGGGGGSAPVVYHVPWNPGKVAPVAPTGLVLYWFPVSSEEVQKSSLLSSRTLSLYATQCITMQLADSRIPNADKLVGESKLPVAILAKADGTPISRVENTNGKLKVDAVEKLVDAEVKTREAALDATMKEAKAKAAAGDNPGAIKLYQQVVGEKCMFAKKAKDAAKELKKLGVTDIASIPASPIFERAQSRLIEQTMRRGLIAENNAQYNLADRLYSKAHRMDPADPTPLRYLGELYRHDIGDWEKAKVEFNAILNMPSDSLSRAVALHGLGKITIHEGEFKKGLGLMEQAVAEYPLALAYRNLAVYWNSEGEFAKGNEYTQQAIAMDPKDPYNLVFAAVFMAASGQREEALKIARANVNLLPASYNLAAIYAQNGQRDKALAFLRRHFYKYERTQSVRSKEMMEARVDAMFDSLRKDPAFLSLTAGADGRLQMPMRGAGGTRENR